MKALFACLPALVIACGPPTFVEPCPEGWSPQQSGVYCAPPKAVVDAFSSQLGTGVFGFHRETHDVSNHLTSTLKAGATVQLVSASAPSPPVSSCMLSPNPVASAVTDSQGVFGISAPPGDYRLEGCMGAVFVTVTSGVVEQDLDLNDVPQ